MDRVRCRRSSEPPPRPLPSFDFGTPSAFVVVDVLIGNRPKLIIEVCLTFLSLKLSLRNMAVEDVLPAILVITLIYFLVRWLTKPSTSA